MFIYNIKRLPHRRPLYSSRPPLPAAPAPGADGLPEEGRAGSTDPLTHVHTGDDGLPEEGRA
eukprot:456086-Pyramimonas_sp.AAC.1